MTEREEALARLSLRLLLRATPLMYAGRRVGMLTLVDYTPGKGPSANGRWTCLCDCGNTSTPRVDNLKAGRTRSCGCQPPRFAERRTTSAPKACHAPRRKPHHGPRRETSGLPAWPPVNDARA